METDNGGWTLFFKYTHSPGDKLILQPNIIPKNLEVNSHINLDAGGFTTHEVQEIRFKCVEIKPDNMNNKLWHFKTNNNKIIQVALFGNQSALDVKYKI